VLRVWVLVSFKILCEKLCLGIGFAFDIKKIQTFALLRLFTKEYTANG